MFIIMLSLHNASLLWVKELAFQIPLAIKWIWVWYLFEGVIQYSSNLFNWSDLTRQNLILSLKCQRLIDSLNKSHHAVLYSLYLLIIPLED